MTSLAVFSIPKVPLFSLDYSYDGYGFLNTIRYIKTTEEKVTTSNYYAATNSMGDVIALYRANGTCLGKYEYDAWGNVIAIRNASDNTLTPTDNPGHIAILNSIRYRGYYYDTDLDLYYLQSRYYDAKTGRFINADSQMSDVGGDVLGNNLFAYCGNNPVNRFDFDGKCSRFLGCLWKVDCKSPTCKTSKNYKNKPKSSLQKMKDKISKPKKGGNTSSVGVSYGYTSGGISVNKSHSVSVDTSYNYAYQKTVSSGVSSGLGASGGLCFTYTNASNVQDLNGDSVSYGVSFTKGLGFSVDYITFNPISDPCKECFGISVVVSLGMEFELHKYENYTNSGDSFNPFK